MSRTQTFIVYFIAIFLQAGAYGLTFMLPRLFGIFNASEKDVGVMLAITAVTTIITVYFSGHLSDIFGRLRTLCIACLAISISLYFYGAASSAGAGVVFASVLLGFGWGLTYSLGPIVLTRLVKPTERVQSFALLSVFVMAGFGLSPVLASLLEACGASIKDAFYITSGLCVISAVLFFILQRPINEYALNPAPEASSRITLSSLSQVLKSPARAPIAMVFLGASVFAGLNNFQTVFADIRGLDYAIFFLVYTLVVVVFRLVLVKFKGGANPYRTIAFLQYLMCTSVVLFMFSGDSLVLYILVAVLFGLGYGVSYPILVAMTASDAEGHLGPQTLQLFALSYFIGIFGFPLIAGWFIVEIGTTPLLALVAVLAGFEATIALRRATAHKTHNNDQLS
ncbi:Predicted arabinose efflux permease, MFS family [Octadecabacter temperatus]|uniref:Major Facilitator Superfamily protein n=1 Tax=Octadecabacter temperatus TaxID=1458307 RepID=A0A0K0Y2P2_9RHOB|nr:MFS transporter [Octadecabacter temperatus]AKS45171.1 Major Facilitator Superfamily protein [Octadecabacter temperatus]SIN87568.1 Predicted arabinose efflux permease, MFS family [Octadecabacter temperatus]